MIIENAKTGHIVETIFCFPRQQKRVLTILHDNGIICHRIDQSVVQISPNHVRAARAIIKEVKP